MAPVGPEARDSQSSGEGGPARAEPILRTHLWGEEGQRSRTQSPAAEHPDRCRGGGGAPSCRESCVSAAQPSASHRGPRAHGFVCGQERSSGLGG